MAAQLTESGKMLCRQRVYLFAPFAWPILQSFSLVLAPPLESPKSAAAASNDCQVTLRLCSDVQKQEWQDEERVQVEVLVLAVSLRFPS